MWRGIALPTFGVDDKRGMQDFAWQFSLFILLVFMLVLPWIFGSYTDLDSFISILPVWPVVLSVYLCAGAVCYPRAIYPVYRCWMVIASILGFINTTVLLAVVYFLIFVPFGWVLRLSKGLQYQSKRCAQISSYYIKRDERSDKSHLHKPF